MRTRISKFISKFIDELNKPMITVHLLDRDTNYEIHDYKIGFLDIVLPLLVIITIFRLIK